MLLKFSAPTARLASTCTCTPYALINTGGAKSDTTARLPTRPPNLCSGPVLLQVLVSSVDFEVQGPLSLWLLHSESDMRGVDTPAPRPTPPIPSHTLTPSYLPIHPSNPFTSNDSSDSSLLNQSNKPSSPCPQSPSPKSLSGWGKPLHSYPPLPSALPSRL